MVACVLYDHKNTVLQVTYNNTKEDFCSVGYRICTFCTFSLKSGLKLDLVRVIGLHSL